MLISLSNYAYKRNRSYNTVYVYLERHDLLKRCKRLYGKYYLTEELQDILDCMYKEKENEVATNIEDTKEKIKKACMDIYENIEKLNLDYKSLSEMKGFSDNLALLALELQNEKRLIKTMSYDLVKLLKRENEKSEKIEAC